jgi:hypothetical protein
LDYSVRWMSASQQSGSERHDRNAANECVTNRSRSAGRLDIDHTIVPSPKRQANVVESAGFRDWHERVEPSADLRQHRAVVGDNATRPSSSRMAVVPARQSTSVRFGGGGPAPLAATQDIRSWSVQYVYQWLPTGPWLRITLDPGSGVRRQLTAAAAQCETGSCAPP